MCTISDTEFKELIRVGRETDRYEFLLESCFFDYIVNLVDNDEDAKQELIIKLIESFDRFELEEDKNYNLLKYYKYRINYWFKHYKTEKDGIISKDISSKIGRILSGNNISEKEKEYLKKYKNIKYIDDFIDEEVCYFKSYEDEILNYINFKEKINSMNEKEKDIIFMRIEGNTLQEIGNKYNCTKENIRQILEKIKEKYLTF